MEGSNNTQNSNNNEQSLKIDSNYDDFNIPISDPPEINWMIQLKRIEVVAFIKIVLAPFHEY